MSEMKNLPDESSGDWSEWRRLIFHEMQRHDGELASMGGRTTKVEMSVAKLNLLAAIFGAIGGIAATAVVQIIIAGG